MTKNMKTNALFIMLIGSIGTGIINLVLIGIGIILYIYGDKN